MRISGTYLERFEYCILPNSLLFGIPIWILGFDAIQIIMCCIIVLLVILLLDIVGIFILYKNPKPLILENNQIRYGDDAIPFYEIRSIQIIIGRCFGWIFRLIKIELLTSETVYAIVKPQTIWDLIRGKYFKTERLIWSVPALRDKLILSNRERKKIIKSFLHDEAGSGPSKSNYST